MPYYCKAINKFVNTQFIYIYNLLILFFTKAHTLQLINNNYTRLKVNNDMTTEEIAKIINCFSNNTVLGPDGIPNEALKTCGPLIVSWLVDVARACFAIGYYPKLERAMTIVVLYKKGKADYLLPKSYHPIALKNTFSKILKRVIAKHIVDIVEKHTLLPQN